MGCASSRPVLKNDPSAIINKSSPCRAPSSTNPTTEIRQDKAPPPKARASVTLQQKNYDTQSSASLVTNSSATAPVAFYGLLSSNNNSSGFTDRTSHNHPDSSLKTRKHVVIARHHADDSTTGLPRTEQPTPVPIPVQTSLRSPQTVAEQSIQTSQFSPTLISFTDGVTAFRGTAMNMPYAILIAGALPPEFVSETAQLIDSVFHQVNMSVNGWNPQSEVSKLNKCPPGKFTSVSAQLASVFDTVDYLHDITDGRFDPTSGVINLAWTKFLTEQNRPPSSQDISHLHFAVGWKSKLKRKSATSCSRNNANTVIDLDGVAKGYAVDCLCDALVDAISMRSGHVATSGVYVDWAGDISACGSHPSGRSWRTAIMNPPSLSRVYRCWEEGTLDSCLDAADVVRCVNLGKGHDQPVLSLDKVISNSSCAEFMGSKLAIATSGDYFQMKRYGYHHIVHPKNKTLMKAGAQSVGSVSVIASSCRIADGLATAAMTCDTAKDAANFLNHIMDISPKERMIAGYCIAGRAGADEKTDVIMSEGFEMMCSVSTEIVKHGHQSEMCDFDCSSSRSDSNSQQSLNQIEQKLLVERFARVAFALYDAKGTIIARTDSMSSLSMMKPEPFVSFILFSPTSVWVPSNGDKVFAVVAAGGLEHISTRPAGVSHLKLRIVDVSPEDSSCIIIIAAVEDTCMARGENCLLEYLGQDHVFSFSPSMSTASPLSLSSPLVDRTKLFFRRLPKPVWILITTSAEGEECAITASSVAAASSCPNLITFNVMQTSAFYAALCGVGSIVRAVALSSEQTEFADRFSGSYTLDSTSLADMCDGSLFWIDAVVQTSVPILDHLFAVANVQRVSTSSARTFGQKENKQPLLRANQTFVELRRQ